MDILESSAYGDEPDDTPDQDDTWRHPKTLGLIALSLAVLCLFGAGPLRGSTYTLLLAKDALRPGANRDLLVAGTFLSAALAVIPVVLARLGLDRLVPEDGEWAGHVLRGALALGAAAVVLDLVRALLALANHDPSAVQVLF